MLTLSYDPSLLQTPHGVTRPEQVFELAEQFRLYGWDRNKPALVGYWNGSHIQLLSGTHRLAAAILAGLKGIPVVVHDRAVVAAAWGNLDLWLPLMQSGCQNVQYTD